MVAASGALAATLAIGMAGAASAEDQHSGGGNPPGKPSDPGGEVLGRTVSRGGGALPLTGGDVIGLSAIGLTAVAAGTTIVVASRRRSVNAPA